MAAPQQQGAGGAAINPAGTQGRAIVARSSRRAWRINGTAQAGAAGPIIPFARRRHFR